MHLHGCTRASTEAVYGGTLCKDLCEDDEIKTIELTVVHRTDDPELLAFLSLARVKQPSRFEIRILFGNRLSTCSLDEAVKFGLSIYARTGKLFVWLCVTNKGVRDVNYQPLHSLILPSPRRIL